MNKLLLSLAVVALVHSTGCKTKDPTPAPPVTPVSQLPPETQSGAGTFGCLVNGQAWNLAGSPLSGPLLSTQYSNKHLSLGASGMTSDGRTSGGVLQLGIDDITTAGRYILTRSDTSFVSYDDIKGGCFYHTDASHPATVEITRLDLVNRIVSGRFSFTLATSGCGPLVVTDGRFDSHF